MGKSQVCAGSTVCWLPLFLLHRSKGSEAMREIVAHPWVSVQSVRGFKRNNRLQFVAHV